MNDVLAGFHYDLNYITIHGKSRYPGLSIWTRDGTKMDVKVPEGCLLIQASKQLEWLTGGDIEAGFHEVIVTQKTLDAIETAKQVQGKSLWRVSSTLFGHISYSDELAPLNQFATAENLKTYPRMTALEQVEKELKMIGLHSSVN